MYKPYCCVSVLVCCCISTGSTGSRVWPSSLTDPGDLDTRLVLGRSNVCTWPQCCARDHNVVHVSTVLCTQVWSWQRVRSRLALGPRAENREQITERGSSPTRREDRAGGPHLGERRTERGVLTYDHVVADVTEGGLLEDVLHEAVAGGVQGVWAAWRRGAGRRRGGGGDGGRDGRNVVVGVVGRGQAVEVAGAAADLRQKLRLVVSAAPEEVVGALAADTFGLEGQRALQPL